MPIPAANLNNRINEIVNAIRSGDVQQVRSALNGVSEEQRRQLVQIINSTFRQPLNQPNLRQQSPNIPNRNEVNLR